MTSGRHVKVYVNHYKGKIHSIPAWLICEEILLPISYWTCFFNAFSILIHIFACATISSYFDGNKTYFWYFLHLLWHVLRPMAVIGLGLEVGLVVLRKNLQKHALCRITDSCCITVQKHKSCCITDLLWNLLYNTLQKHSNITFGLWFTCPKNMENKTANIRVYAQDTVFGLVFGLVQRDQKLPRRCDGLKTENPFETGKQFLCFRFWHLDGKWIFAIDLTSIQSLFTTSGRGKWCWWKNHLFLQHWPSIQFRAIQIMFNHVARQYVQMIKSKVDEMIIFSLFTQFLEPCCFRCISSLGKLPKMEQRQMWLVGRRSRQSVESFCWKLLI
jgi:hypothetical protein